MFVAKVGPNPIKGNGKFRLELIHRYNKKEHLEYYNKIMKAGERPEPMNKWIKDNRDKQHDSGYSFVSYCIDESRVMMLDTGYICTFSDCEVVIFQLIVK